ncbi:macro domain-containing protein [uncultured Gimesia sp.]|uniref:macro domain-containing protein n=1 Tax=uncultured Gimesia sp. TaxID=1678688 RepID=UPI002606B586|nr:macro domain-containing protein [uncultured Gimesia sp.]
MLGITRKKSRLQIRLTGIDTALTHAWQRWCGDLPFVSVYQGSIFDEAMDAIVSPANSFGFMDGGIDRLYLERFGQSLQDRVQTQIKDDHAGELLVGAATIVETNDASIPFLIAAPTMRVPLALDSSINPFLAARAIFLLIRDGIMPSGRYAGEPVRDHVKSVSLPGLGTGVGRVPPVQCAKQVRAAIEDVVMDKFTFPTTTSQIRKRHDRLIES